MAQTGKEKQARYRKKMKNAGYKLVQLWVKDKDGEELKRYIRDLEKGVRRPKTSLKWDCERVVLEMHVKSREVAARDCKARGLMEGLLRKAIEGYQAKEIPKYVYVDIVELLRPLLGEELYVAYKTWFEVAKVGFKERVFRALVIEEVEEPLDEDVEKWVRELLGVPDIPDIPD